MRRRILLFALIFCCLASSGCAKQRQWLRGDSASKAALRRPRCPTKPSPLPARRTNPTMPPTPLVLVPMVDLDRSQPAAWSTSLHDKLRRHWGHCAKTPCVGRVTPVVRWPRSPKPGSSNDFGFYARSECKPTRPGAQDGGYLVQPAGFGGHRPTRSPWTPRQRFPGLDDGTVASLSINTPRPRLFPPPAPPRSRARRSSIASSPATTPRPTARPTCRRASA